VTTIISRTTRHPSRVFAGITLGALLLVGGASCGGGAGSPSKAETKTSAPKTPTTHHTRAHHTAHTAASSDTANRHSAPTTSPTTSPTSKPAPAGSGPVGRTVTPTTAATSPTQQANSNQSQESSTPTGPTSNPATVDQGPNAGGAPSSDMPPAASPYVPPTGYTPPDSGSYYDPNYSSGNVGDIINTNNPVADQYTADANAAYTESTNRANAGDVPGSYNANQDYLNNTAASNDAYNAPPDTTPSTSDGG